MLKRIVLTLVMLCMALPAYAWQLQTRVATGGGNMAVNGLAQTSANGTVYKTYTNDVQPAVVLTADDGYKISSTSINGVAQSPVPVSPANYTMGVVIYPTKTVQSVLVYYTKQTYPLTTAAATGGSVSPVGTSQVQFGTSKTVIFSPLTGKNLVAIDGQPAGTVLKNYSTGAVITLPAPLNVKVSATFNMPASAVTLTGQFVSLTASTNGPATVLTNSSVTLTATSDPAGATFAWSQTGGPGYAPQAVPPQTGITASGATLTFTPAVAGTYNFKVVATSGGNIAIADTYAVATDDAVAAAEAQCNICHLSRNLGQAEIAGWSDSPHAANQVMCYGCHIGAASGAHPGAIPSNATCTTCHTPLPHGSGLTTCLTCHDPHSLTGSGGMDVGVTDSHGQAFLAAEELATAGKYPVNVAITGATADAGGVATVNFHVTNRATGAPVETIGSISAGIFKLSPPAAGESFTRWVPYLWRSETVSETIFPMPSGFQVNQGYRESSSAGTLTNDGGGNYTYRFGKNLTTASQPIGGVPITYERNRTHRVSVYMGGHNGPTGEGDFDFVPDGSTLTLTRNIVQTAACQKCHGPEFAGHGGDRVTVEGCVTCHSPGSYDAQSGQTIEMAVMIHKLHAGWELAKNTGPDGAFWSNPNAAGDELADNGTPFFNGLPYYYTLWGNSNRPVSLERTEFPAVLANCQACHTGTGTDVGSWKTKPSRAACGSCHDKVDFAIGTNHDGGIVQTSDASCTVCHPASGTPTPPVIYPVEYAHNWTTQDIRNKPEFDIDLTVSTPANGQYFVAGESPVVSIVLKKGGFPIDHTTVIEDAAAEGCIPKPGFEATECTVPSDGLFRNANMYVTGPRAQRIPVLSYAARAKVFSGALSTATWDLTALTSEQRAVRVRVDSGAEIIVTLPAAVVNVANVVSALNADPLFAARAIAYADEANGKLAVRSRAIGTAQPNIQVVTSPASMFPTTVGMAGGAAQVRARTNPANNDPKLVLTSGSINYTLDPVDDLASGTYVVNVEFADAGRGSSLTGEPPYEDYRTPSVKVASFQVKQESVEKPIAGNCGACHWSDAGRGYVLDNPRHNKPFTSDSVEQCAGCHDYQSGMNPTATTALTWENWGGGKAISKRVHAVHNGAALNYPLETVGHEETFAMERDWRISFPMDVRNCESCHPTGTTSGTWATNPSRLACGGCHDSDWATGHMNDRTSDPTPLAPWSGDESESCMSCH